jgi:hypothetical protein
MLYLFKPFVYYNFCSDGELSSEHHSLHLVSGELKSEIFSNMCKFVYCCVDIMFTFLKNYVVVSIKVIHLNPWIYHSFPSLKHVTNKVIKNNRQ